MITIPVNSSNCTIQLQSFVKRRKYKHEFPNKYNLLFYTINKMKITKICKKNQRMSSDFYTESGNLLSFDTIFQFHFPPTNYDHLCVNLSFIAIAIW